MTFRGFDGCAPLFDRPQPAPQVFLYEPPGAPPLSARVKFGGGRHQGTSRKSPTARLPAGPPVEEPWSPREIVSGKQRSGHRDLWPNRAAPGDELFRKSGPVSVVAIPRRPGALGKGRSQSLVVRSEPHVFLCESGEIPRAQILPPASRAICLHSHLCAPDQWLLAQA
jgi:hypothetical protein